MKNMVLNLEHGILGESVYEEIVRKNAASTLMGMQYLVEYVIKAIALSDIFYSLEKTIS